MNKKDVVLGIMVAIGAVILFIVWANVTGGYSANWLPYAVALAVLGSYWVWFERRHLARQKQLASQLQGFADYVNVYLTPPVGVDSQCSPYINGKIFPVSRFSDQPQLVRPNSIHQDIYWDLSKDLRATNDGQVGTIVWIDLGKQSAQKEDGLQTVRQCRITVIDRVRSMMVGETTLETSDSRYKMPVVTEFGMSVEFSSLGWYRQMCDEILNYLEGLPRKQVMGEGH